MKRVILVALVALAAPRDTRACVCDMPPLSFVSPSTDAAPTNTHVRIRARRVIPLASFIVRPHGGANVPVSARAIPGDSLQTQIELIPTSPLTPNTRFEVATVDPTIRPSTTVIGTFKTSASADASAPRLESLGPPVTYAATHVGTCPSFGPWITLDHVVAHDDRADAQLAFGVWVADSTGRLDTKRPPDDLVFPHDGKVLIGDEDPCNYYWFKLAGGPVNLAVAAIDEAGNTSPALPLHAD